MPIIICLLLTLMYVLLMVAYRIGWARQNEFVLPTKFVPSTFISVVIPTRNEQANIAACMASILAQKYPPELFEVIVVDDYSEDETVNIVNGYAAENVHCIKLADYLEPGKTITAYKKAAIAAGINYGKGTLIVTTDADCTAPNSWLLHIAAIYEREHPVMVVAPVIYTAHHRLLPVFQLIDFMGMQGITAAAHRLQLGNMGNGANLAFRKAAFEEVDGYDGIDHLATGDDYLLMVKLRKLAPGGIAYLKSVNAIVSTAPQPDWRSFIRQRVRWSSKSGKYKDTRLNAILVLVYLFNLSIAVLFIVGFFHPVYFYVAVSMLGVKIVAEYIFLAPVAGFFGKRWVMPYFPFLQPLHILYVVCAGLLGFVGRYEWKGRNVR